MDDPSDVKKLANLWNLPWPILEVMVGGVSALDLPSLDLKNEEDAEKFLKVYGFDVHDPQDQEKIEAIFIEAIHFLGVHLMPREWNSGCRPPEIIWKCRDARKLLLWASNPGPLQAWSCSLLRVMHTIAHIDGVQSDFGIDYARNQVMTSIKPHLAQDDHGVLWLSSDHRKVRLLKLEWKNEKTRPSVILKLLHKQANVAETIYDFLGMRFILYSQADILALLTILREIHLVIYPNISPMKARNNLIDLPIFKKKLNELRESLLRGDLNCKEFEKELSQIHALPCHRTLNPHSGRTFRSLQLTCWHKITIPTPNEGWISKVHAYLKEPPMSKALHLLLSQSLQFSQDWLKGENMHNQIFFPFEIQIMDKKSAEKIKVGPAAHYRYKNAQLLTAKKRILRGILP